MGSNINGNQNQISKITQVVKNLKETFYKAGHCKSYKKYKLRFIYI